MTQSEARKKALALMSKWGLTDIRKNWTFKFNNSKSAFGQCQFKRNRFTGEIHSKKICLSSYFLPALSDESVIDTILHEIAHALDVEDRGYSNHDLNWKRMAIKVGAKPQTCASHDDEEVYAKLAKQSKYTHVCPNGHEFPSHRRDKAGIRKSCPTCNPDDFDPRYILKQVQNY